MSDFVTPEAELQLGGPVPPPSRPTIHFTEVDHHAETIRDALRKLDPLDEDGTRAAAGEGLGSLLTVIDILESRLAAKGEVR